MGADQRKPRPGRRQRLRCAIVCGVALVLWGLRWLWQSGALPASGRHHYLASVGRRKRRRPAAGPVPRHVEPWPQTHSLTLTPNPQP